MNILKGIRIYTVGCMEFADGQDWRRIVENQLKPLGIKIFNPYHKPFSYASKEDEKARRILNNLRINNRFTQVHKKMKEIRSEDLRICDISDAFIVYIKPEIPSWGSAEELVTAVRMKKPIFVIVEGGKKKCPLWIFGMLPPKYIYDSLDSVIDMIKKIDNGNKKIDSKRWRILKPEYL